MSRTINNNSCSSQRYPSLVFLVHHPKSEDRRRSVATMKLALKILLLVVSVTTHLAVSSSTTSASSETTSPMDPTTGTSLGASYAVSYSPEDYDDYEHVASLLNGTCTFNTFMCCWTRNDGDGMEENTDVCRYVDPTGVSIDFPGESEGETHCHGFGWPEGSEYVNHILPLYFFVRKFDHSQYRGYYGK